MDCVKVLSVVMPANTYFKFIQYEKIIQMAFLLVLFFGLSGILGQVIDILYYAVGSVFF